MFRTRSSIWWLSLAGALLLAGCLRPMLAEAPFCLIMPEPEDRLQQQFTLAMGKLVRGGGGACYQLKYSLMQQKESVLIDRDGEIARSNLVQICKFRLLDGGGREVLQDQIMAVAGFNNLDADYSTYVAQQGTQELLAKEMADKVYARLVSAVARGR